MNLKLSKDIFFNYLIMIIFVLLIPIQEWPDANTHFARENIYSEFILKISHFFNISYPKFLASNNFSFFSDKFIYQTYIGDKIPNLIKLILIIPLIYILNKFSVLTIDKSLSFSPPLIFALLATSLEPFAIGIMIIGFFYVKVKKFFLGFFLGFIATMIDRSMVPSFFGIIFLASYLVFNDKKKLIFFISVFFYIILVLYFTNFFSMSAVDPIFSYYGLTDDEINYNLQFGERNIFALLASLSGLYGWMSLRPFPWFIYYTIVILCFAIGFLKTNKYKKFELLIFLMPTVIVLYFLPPLSQARYYPILILLYWENILLGAKILFKRDEVFSFLVLIMTSIGLYLV